MKNINLLENNFFLIKIKDDFSFLREKVRDKIQDIITKNGDFYKYNFVGINLKRAIFLVLVSSFLSSSCISGGLQQEKKILNQNIPPKKILDQDIPKRLELKTLTSSQKIILPDNDFSINVGVENPNDEILSGILKYKVHPMFKIKKVTFDSDVHYSYNYGINKLGLITVDITFFEKGKGELKIELYYPDYIKIFELEKRQKSNG